MTLATAYRVSSIFIVVFGTLFSLSEIVASVIYYRSASHIVGWTFYQYLALIATFNFIQYGYQFWFVSGHEALLDNIVDGQLDYTLVRPVDAQVACSLAGVDLASAVNMVVPMGIMAYALAHGRFQLSLLVGVAYIGLLAMGIGMYYALNQIVVSLGFWIERPQKLSGVPEYMFELASRPSGIYPRVLQYALTFGLPLLVATNLPVELLEGRESVQTVAALCGGVGMLLVVSRVLWKAGLRKYVSAS